MSKLVKFAVECQLSVAMSGWATGKFSDGREDLNESGQVTVLARVLGGRW